ncbi:hypothetical protein ACR0ST_00650 [Aliidiomarina sp. Khilg15.8]
MIRGIFLIVILSGCAAQTTAPGFPEQLPEATGTAIIYSVGSAHEIDDDSYYDGFEAEALDSFEGYLKIIDKADVTDMADVKSSIDIINEGVGEHDVPGMSFEPRYAIKYPSVYGEVTALICFDCSTVLVTIDDWSKWMYFVSEPRVQLEALYDRYDVKRPVTNPGS